MGVMDIALHVGVESTYGTPVAPTRSFEAKADAWKANYQRIDSVGMRAGYQALRSDRRVVVNMGGAGSLEVDVLNKGMGLLFQGLLGGAVAPTQQASTSAYLQTYTSTSDGPNKSYTIQQVRPKVTSGSEEFTHHGCVATAWSLSQNVDGLLVLNISYDFEDVDTTTAAGTPTYPAATTPFHWAQCSATIDGDAVSLRDFTFQADLGFKVDRRYLRGSSLKKQPVRAAVPGYSGTINVDFEDLTRYEEYVAGTVTPLVVTWTGGEIESPHNYEIELSLPAVEWTGESPTASMDDLAVQPLPFRALYNGTDPTVTLTYMSTDTTV